MNLGLAIMNNRGFALVLSHYAAALQINGFIQWVGGSASSLSPSLEFGINGAGC
jgi:hypothetical protein